MPNAAYTQPFRFPATLDGAPLTVVSKAGLADGSTVGAAASLVATLVQPAATETVLLRGCGPGARGVALARRLVDGHLTLTDPSLLALQLAEQTLAANGITGVTVSAAVSHLPAGAGRFDRVIILAPQSRALGRRWLVEAHALLRPGGILHLAGANSGGIQSLSADAAAYFGAAHTLGYKQGCRVTTTTRRDPPPEAPPWATLPGIAPGTWHQLQVALPAGTVTLCSLPGIFSYDRLDAGTALLLQQLEASQGQRVLDAGCGYGPIGIAAARLGAEQVDMLDVNLLAVAAAQANVARLGLTGVTVEASDALLSAAERRYDVVLSNPPFHAGQAKDTAVAEAFITQARSLLNPGGRLLLVANRFLPYERLLLPWYTRVTVVAQNQGYRVLLGET